MRAVTASAPATTSDGDANARANANAANVADALAYVREVRARFVDESWRYHEFLRAMKAFKRGTCVRSREAMTTLTADVVVESVRACLAGHDDLLDGFKAFLPEGYAGAEARGAPRGGARGASASASASAGGRRIKEEESNARRSASLHDGQELLKRIRQKYAADERPYHAFLQALIKFRNKQFSAEEVVQKCAILFYDQPEVLEGEDGLATFVPKTCHPPKRSSWFDWSPAVHHRFGSDNFRLFVRTLLLCEYKSRMNPPEPKMRRWRLTDGDSSESDSDDYSSSEESETESSQQVEKEPGTLRPDQIPSRWVGEEKDRVMSAFERMTLTLEPKDDEYCWADTKEAREAKENKEEIEIRGKRGRTEERDYSSTPRESPSPPPSFNKRRASARIIAKVNRGIVYNRFRSLSSPDGLARGRMRMTRSMSTVSNDLPAKPKNKLILNRDSNKMSPNCAERIGLHSLPADVLQRVIAHYSVQEGKAELNQIRESLIKSLLKNYKGK